MEKDILSLFVINDSTKQLIKKNLKLTFILIIVSIVYSIFDLYDWFSHLAALSPVSRNSQHYFYNYKMRPIIAVIVLSLGVIGHFMRYSAYKFITSAVENNDTESLNEGFKKFYIINILILISFLISTISLFYRIFFY